MEQVVDALRLRAVLLHLQSERRIHVHRFNLLASFAELFEEGTDSGTTVAVPSPQDAVRSVSMIAVA